MDKERKAEMEATYARLVREGKVVVKGTAEERARHRQEIMDSLKVLRMRANAVRLGKE